MPDTEKLLDLAEFVAGLAALPGPAEIVGHKPASHNAPTHFSPWRHHCLVREGVAASLPGLTEWLFAPPEERGRPRNYTTIGAMLGLDEKTTHALMHAGRPDRVEHSPVATALCLQILAAFGVVDWEAARAAGGYTSAAWQGTVTSMQTFLPHPSFAHSAAVLDRARLGKQRLECQTMLGALSLGSVGAGMPAWGNHPATLMWRGYESALGLYMTLVVREWSARGYTNNLIAPYLESGEVSHVYADTLVSHTDEVEMPPWLGREEFHASHRAALLLKMPEHYGQFGWTEEPRLDYWWPTRETTK